VFLIIIFLVEFPDAELIFYLEASSISLTGHNIDQSLSSMTLNETRRKYVEIVEILSSEKMMLRFPFSTKRTMN